MNKGLNGGFAPTPGTPGQTSGNISPSLVNGLASGETRPNTFDVLGLAHDAIKGDPFIVPDSQYGDYTYDPKLATKERLGLRHTVSGSTVFVEGGHVHYIFSRQQVGDKVMIVLRGFKGIIHLEREERYLFHGRHFDGHLQAGKRCIRQF